MKKWFILGSVLVFCLFGGDAWSGVWRSSPKIDEKHIRKDLIGKTVQSWTFQKGEPCRIKMLDAKYDKDTAVAYISIRVMNKRWTYGYEGKFRLEYEYAADDWNLLDIKAIFFSGLKERDIQALQAIKDYPLFMAVYDQDVDRVKCLIADGHDVNGKIEGGMTPLFYAVLKGHLDVAKLLVDKGADLDHKLPNGQNLLMAAVLFSQVPMVEFLLARGADVDAKKDVHGWTGLWHAISEGNLSLAKVLVDNGADVNARDEYGKTLLVYARWRGNAEIIQLLEQAGAVAHSKDDDMRKLAQFLAKELPAPKGLVNDFGNVIPATYEKEINKVASTLLEKKSVALFVVTVPDIAGADYNHYAHSLYNIWSIGKKVGDKGVLLFVTIKERKMRIEVGPGLHQVLPDELCAKIRDMHMIPYLKQNNFGEGLLKGTLAINEVISRY